MRRQRHVLLLVAAVEGGGARASRRLCKRGRRVAGRPSRVGHFKPVPSCLNPWVGMGSFVSCALTCRLQAHRASLSTRAAVASLDWTGLGWTGPVQSVQAYTSTDCRGSTAASPFQESARPGACCIARWAAGRRGCQNCRTGGQPRRACEPRGAAATWLRLLEAKERQGRNERGARARRSPKGPGACTRVLRVLMQCKML